MQMLHRFVSVGSDYQSCSAEKLQQCHRFHQQCHALNRIRIKPVRNVYVRHHSLYPTSNVSSMTVFHQIIMSAPSFMSQCFLCLFLQEPWLTLEHLPVSIGWTSWYPWALCLDGTLTNSRTRSSQLSGTKVLCSAGKNKKPLWYCEGSGPFYLNVLWVLQLYTH